MANELRDLCVNFAERSDCPVGTRELNRLAGIKVNMKMSNDEICKTCQNGVFRIERLECPVCGSLEVCQDIQSEIAYAGKEFYYTCKVCKGRLMSILILER